MTQKSIEAKINAADPDSFAGVRDNVFKELSALVDRGLLAEAYAMVPIADERPHPLLTRHIAALTADVPFHSVRLIIDTVGRIPGLEITRADYVEKPTR